MTISGRRPTGLGRSILEGLSALGTALADGSNRERIKEIDKQVKDLLQERDHLIHDLIEPGDLKVSENYDPFWKKSGSTTTIDHDDEIGRLTECGGRSTSGRYHDAHPACPYVDTIHNAHEFTLRD